MAFKSDQVVELILNLAAMVQDTYSPSSFDYNQTDPVVDKLLNHRQIQAHYSRRHLTSELWNHVGQLMKSTDRKKRTTQWLNSLCSSRPVFQQWSVVGGLINVRTCEPLTLGTVFLRPNTNSQIDDLLSNAIDQCLATEQRSTREPIDGWIRNAVSTLGGDCLVTVNIAAADVDKAQHLAKELFEEVIAGLRYLAYVNGIDTAIGMRGMALQRELSGLILVSEQGITVATYGSAQSDEDWFPFFRMFSNDDDGPRPEHCLDLDALRQSGNGNYLERLGNILRVPKAERTDLQNRMVNALRWFGEGSIERSNTDAFIKFAISLEALLGQDDPNAPIIGPLAEKVAFIRGRTSSREERLSYYKEAKELYGQRSRVVHSGLSPSDSRTTGRMESLIADVLSQFLQQNWLQTYKDWKEFSASFDDLKFS